jgi:hypothetical protein
MPISFATYPVVWKLLENEEYNIFPYVLPFSQNVPVSCQYFNVIALWFLLNSSLNTKIKVVHLC